MYKNCKVMVLPIEKESKIYAHRLNPRANKEDCLVFGINYTKRFDHYGVSKNYHLYILSDEKIKEGDWVFNILINELIEVNKEQTDFWDGDLQNTFIKKIIATTDESLLIISNFVFVDSRTGEGMSYEQRLPDIPQSFIQLFCENNSINEIMVEYYNKYKGSKCDKCGEISIDEENTEEPICSHCKEKNYNEWTHIYNETLKLDNATIVIKPIKTNWTEEEIKSVINYTKSLNYMDGTKSQSEFTPSDILVKWMQDNSK